MVREPWPRSLAYLRGSKDTQDVTHQRLAVLEFARRERLTVDDFLEVSVSATRSLKERKADLLLARLVPGDTLIVRELSRLGRSVGDIITTVDTLVKQRVQMLAIKEGIQPEKTPDLRTRLMVTMFSLFAEIERELISLRTKEALAAARATRYRWSCRWPTSCRTGRSPGGSPSSATSRTASAWRPPSRST
jgi:DNA invertase Pin-like site-specific DNA recombinase